MDIFQTEAGYEVPQPIRESSPLRILIILEARSVTGPGKAVLEFTQKRPSFVTGYLLAPRFHS